MPRSHWNSTECIRLQFFHFVGGMFTCMSNCQYGKLFTNVFMYVELAWRVKEGRADRQYHTSTGHLTDLDVGVYGYNNCRQAQITLDAGVALNPHTLIPPVCTITDTDNHNLKWLTVLRNVCSLFVPTDITYLVIPRWRHTWLWHCQRTSF
jgi:hypothetical protein